jgi:hypothetical protein
MSEEVSTENPTTPVPETTTETEKELPADVLRRLLKEARDEAAANRVKGNEKAEAAKTEVTQEYEGKLSQEQSAHEVTRVELTKTQLNYEKLNTALDAGVPADKARAFASALQGSTPEELKAHAETLKSLFGIGSTPASVTPPVDPTAGTGNNVLPLNGDPLLRAIEGIVNKR